MRAFTLVELLTVIGQMALIIGGGVAVFGLAREGTLRQQAKSSLASLATQVEAAKPPSGAYPADLSGFQSSPDTTDPWGKAVIYQVAADGGHFTLTSMGTDQMINTNDDIVYDSWKN